MKNNSTLRIVFCAFFAALTAVLSQLVLPIGPVPINLATFSMYLSGSVLGPAAGALSQAVYVLLGAAGVPVFAGFRGGIQALLGPTGGYIIGYIAGSAITGLLYKRAEKRILKVLSMAVGMAACYTLGTIWFVILTGTGVWASLTACVFPFIPGDALKIAAASAVAPSLRKALHRLSSGKAEA